jgi:L-alanine-DL-glutamate epimerase-like enolase superfamily enzyme
MSISKRWTETKGTVARAAPEPIVGAYRQVIRRYGLNKGRVDIAISAAIGIALWEFAGQATPAIVFVWLSETVIAWQELIASGE